MKKLIIAASMLAAALTSNAQDAYKFAAGDNNLEFASAPFSGSPLAIPQIKYRRFLSESLAFRLGLNLTLQSKTTPSEVPSNKAGAAPDSKIELKDKESTFGWELAPGIEKHFAGTERLSPYVGAELRIAGSSYKNTSEFQAANDKIETVTLKNAELEGVTLKSNEKGFFALGLNLIAGADFYFAKKLYLGGEFGYGFGFTKYSDISIESTAIVAPAKQADPIVQPSEFGIGSNLGALSGKLKLGFLF